MQIRMKGYIEEVFPAAWFTVGGALHTKLVLGKWMGLFVKQNSLKHSPVQVMEVTENQPFTSQIHWWLFIKSSSKTLVETVSIQLITDLLNRALPVPVISHWQLYFTGFGAALPPKRCTNWRDAPTSKEMHSSDSPPTSKGTNIPPQPTFFWLEKHIPKVNLTSWQH